MTQNHYQAWGEKNPNYGDYIDDLEPVYHTSLGSSDREFVGEDTNISVRSEFLRSDYDYYRSHSATPVKPQKIIEMCMKAYSRIGIVRNVIDLMADFACQGIRLQHPNPSEQRFYNRWFEEVKGKDRSERWLNLFYRSGNVITSRDDAKLPADKVKKWKKAHGAEFTDVKILKREIPFRYHFLNPISLGVVGGDMATFTGKTVYTLKLTTQMKSAIKRLKKENVDFEIPDYIMQAINSGQTQVVLPEDKIRAAHYKKDDWQVWAEPMTYAIFDDLVTFEKMRLADLAALDGAISNIRLWRLGFIDEKNPAQSILPNKSAINKFRNILHHNVGGGVIDMVTGPEVDFKEASTQVHRFLGSQKYEICLNAIYDGLGIPPTLRSGGKSIGGSGSFVALKTLIQRLQYGRAALIQFWNEEIKRVQKAMGFEHPAQVVFDQLIMADESTEKQLLIQLADRDLISTESLQEKFGMLPEIEKLRINREDRKRGKSMPNKASPFHNPQWDTKIKETLLQKGMIQPEDVGLDLDSFEVPEQDTKRDGGRPPNVVETQKRKKKPEGNPQTGKNVAAAYVWVNEAYKTIAHILSPAVLKTIGKKNYRQLTHSEAKTAEWIKFSTLMGLDLYSQINEQTVVKATEQENLSPEDKKAFAKLKSTFVANNQREPNMDELRSIFQSTYILRRVYEEE